MQDARQTVTGFVETQGTRLYYEVIGEGHSLVLLHGGYMERPEEFNTLVLNFLRSL